MSACSNDYSLAVHDFCVGIRTATRPLTCSSYAGPACACCTSESMLPLSCPTCSQAAPYVLQWSMRTAAPLADCPGVAQTSATLIQTLKGIEVCLFECMRRMDAEVHRRLNPSRTNVFLISIGCRSMTGLADLQELPRYAYIWGDACWRAEHSIILRKKADMGSGGRCAQNGTERQHERGLTVRRRFR